MDIEKTHRSRAGRIAVAALLLGAASPLAAAQAPAAGTGQSAIDADALRSAASDETVRAFYEQHGWQPVWTDAAASALDTVLAGRAAHGLDRLSFAAKPGDGAGAAAVEVARTGAALRYARALAQGLTDPASLHAVFTLDRPAAEVAKPLAEAIARGRLADWFASLAPQDSDYASLSKAYRAARDEAATQADAANGSPRPADAASGGDAASDDGEVSAKPGLIQPGDSDDRVPAIVRQLVAGGYLAATAPPPSSGSSGAASGGSDGSAQPESASSAERSDPRRYTSRIEGAVKQLQEDYGIARDGVVGPDTLQVLNLQDGDRARALAVALERRRWEARNPAATRIDVNIAAAELRYYRDGKMVDTRKVIVGQPGNETPLLASPIYRLVANPTWTVPKSIEKAELSNLSSSELAKRNMVRRDGWIVQKSGPDNALGLVKFDMLNDQAIYLHDTGSPSLFERSDRHLSHGCVRVDDALGFAKLLAADAGITDKWEKAHAGDDQTFVELPEKLPVRLLYRNAFVDTGGEVALRTDPYGWNAPIAKALGFSEGSTRRVAAKSGQITP